MRLVYALASTASRTIMRHSYTPALVAVLLLVVSGCSAGMRAMTPDQAELTSEFTHSLTQDAAFSRVMEWVAQTYNSPGTVTEVEDRASGLIVVRAINSVSRMGVVVVPVTYTASIQPRDNRLRIQWRITGQSDPEIGGVSGNEATATRARFTELATELEQHLASAAY